MFVFHSLSIEHKHKLKFWTCKNNELVCILYLSTAEFLSIVLLYNDNVLNLMFIKIW